MTTLSSVPPSSSSVRLQYELALGRDIAGVKNVQQGRISSDGYISFMITEGRQVKIIDNESKLVVATFYSPSDINTCCYYTPNNSAREILCCFTKEKEFFTIDLSSGRKLSQFNLDYEINDSLAVENHLVVLTNDGIGLIDHELNFQHLPLDNPTSIYYNKEKDLIIVGFESGKIVFYKILNNSLEKVFTQQLCNDSISSISINNIGKQHDFTLLVGTEANELVMFYFVDYFKSYQSKQSIDLTNYAQQLTQVKLVNIDKYSSLILLQDGFNVKLLIFNLNIWLSSANQQLESSLTQLDIENLNCSVLDVHVNDYIQYQSNNLTRLEINVLSNQSIHTVTMKKDNTMITNPSLEKLLHQYRANINQLFDDLYDNNLIPTLVEYIEGTVLNQEDLILPFNNEAPMRTSQNIKKRFIVHDIKDITSWIKNSQESEFKELDKNLQDLLKVTNRTTPPLVLQECKKVLQKSIRKLETLCLLIQSIIHRAKLIENVGDDYTPNLVKYKETINSKVEYVKIMIWLIQNGLLPMTSNIYNFSKLQTEWNHRKEQPFPINKINVTEDEFNSILNIMNLSSVDTDMVPTYTATNTKNFLIEHMIEKCQVEYPPKDLKAFISQIFASNISLQFKHLIIFYLILDNNQDTNEKDISILNKYAKEFNISAPYQHFAVGLWLLDTKRTHDSILNQAIHYLSNLFINNNEACSLNELDIWISSILTILLKSCSFNAAQRLLNVLYETSTSSMDITSSSNKKYTIDTNIQVLIYLTNDMYHLAFDYCRSMESESEKRKTFFCIIYYSLVGNCFIDLLSIFPFDEMESFWIEEYLKKEKKNELLLSYYIMNSNYIDAYHLSLQFNNSNFLAIIGNILPPIQKVKLDQNTPDVKKNPLLKMGGRRINQPIFAKNGNQLKVINQLTSFKSWLDTNDKTSTFTIPSLFDATSPKWIGKHRKHLLPSVEKQDLLYLPPNKMKIPEKMVDEDEESTTSSSESEMGVKQVVTNDYVPPRSQYGQKTVRVSRPASEDASSSGSSVSEEEEAEQSLMVNRLDYNRFKQVENQTFDNSNKKDLFDSSEEEDEEDDYDSEDDEEEQPEQYVISD